MSTSAAILAAIIWLTIQTGIALDNSASFSKIQEKPADAAPQEEDLPEFAIRRIGKVGKKSGNDGFYRIAFSPDQKFLATRNRENIVALTDFQTGKQVFQFEGGESLVNWLQFSPDSSMFLTASKFDKDAVKLWDTKKGKKVLEFGTDISEAHFSVDGSSVIALGQDSVEKYLFASGELFESKKWKTNGNPRRHTMSRDGQLVVTSSTLNKKLHQIHVLDLTSKTKTILDGPSEEIKTVAISPNKLWVASSYQRNPKVQLWDLRDPQNEKFVLALHEQTVQSLSFSPDGRFLVSTSWDDTAIVWDLLSREPVAHLKGHLANVNSSAFSPFGLFVATGASGPNDSSILVWNLNSMLFPDNELPPAFDAFREIWKELGSAFPAQAFSAVKAIYLAEDTFIEQLANKIGVNGDGLSSEEINQWIQELNDPSYVVRERATEKLLAARGVADLALHEALANPPSTEVIYRINLIFRQPIKRPKINFDELRRLHRSIFALELIGSPKAVEVLSAIGSRHPNIDVAKDASDAVSRIQAR